MNSILQRKAIKDLEKGIKRKFSDRNRVDDFTFKVADLTFDLSKTHVDHELVDFYADDNLQRDFGGCVDRLFSGENVNSSEDRAVLHHLLRSNNGADESPQVNSNQLKEAQSAKNDLESIHDLLKKKIDCSSPKIESIIHIGIGGSFLGPKLLDEALEAHFTGPSATIHFLSNIDGHALDNILKSCDPKTTLVIAVSKTFTTLETLMNMNSVRAWLEAQNNEDSSSRLFAVTAAPKAARAQGIPADNIVPFPSWVGGRYSVWSSVSMSVILELGKQAFRDFLSGAEEVDNYFRNAPLTKNACFISAALDHYYVNYLGVSSRAVFPYDFRLRSLVDYLQQLETESNGKDRTIDGSPIVGKTSPAVWGGVGTDVQHSVFQMMHQGTHIIPAEFILVAKPDHGHSSHHRELLANGLAQAAALLKGQTLDEVRALSGEDDKSEVCLNSKIFSGERPSAVTILKKLTPSTLGQLLAFYENRTLSFGLICSINSFDQMGVELGKRLARELNSGVDAADSFDPSTRSLLKRLDM